MTKEQTEKMRDFVVAGRWADACAYVSRLLEERKRLLEALEVAVALREGAIYDVNGVPSGMLREALSFASSPAP